MHSLGQANYSKSLVFLPDSYQLRICSQSVSLILSLYFITLFLTRFSDHCFCVYLFLSSYAWVSYEWNWMDLVALFSFWLCFMPVSLALTSSSTCRGLSL